MHRCLTICVLLAAAAPFAAAQQARIEGTVVSTTGGPVRRALVRLQSNATGAPGNPISYVEMTDASGRYAFENLPPGRYLLTGQKTGFAVGRYQTPDNQSQLNLSAGTVLRDAVIRMTPNAVISGLVLNADGDPAVGAQVRVMTLTFTNGGMRLSPGVSAGVDDHGQFRLSSVTPGRYFLMAEDVSARHNAAQPGIIGAADFDFDLPTYYPSETDLRRATAVDATAGTEVAGVQIRMLRGRVFSVRGQVLDPAGQPAGVNVTLMPKLGAGFANVSNSSTVSRAETGVFEFGGVLPGEYVLQAAPTRPVIRPVEGAPARAVLPPVVGSSGRLTVFVGGADVDNVVLALKTNVEVGGRMVIEGGATALRPTVALAEAEGVAVNAQTRAQVEPDGRFRIENVPVGLNYAISVTPPPPGHYLKTVRWGGRDMVNQWIDVNASGALELVFAKDGAEITGTLRTSSGDPRSGLAVVAWPKTPRRSESGGGVRVARTDAQGAFRIPAIPPGSYYIAAFQVLNQQAYDFMTRFNASAAEIDLGSDAMVTVEPKVIPRETVDAQMMRLQ